MRQQITLGFGSLEAELLGIRTARRSGNMEEAGKRLRTRQMRFGSEAGIELEEELLAIQQGESLDHAQELLDAHATNGSEEAVWVLEAYIVGCLQKTMPAYAQNLTYEGSRYAKEVGQAPRNRPLAGVAARQARPGGGRTGGVTRLICSVIFWAKRAPTLTGAGAGS